MKPSRACACVFAAVLLVAFLGGCKPNYVFEPEDIHQIAKDAFGLPIEDAIAQIRQTLKDRYPGKIRDDIEWHFNWTGGTLGQMALLYASTKEYVLIFGSPIGSEGFSGRYPFMTVYDCMFAGEMSTYTEGQIEKTLYLPGDCAVLERNQGKGYSMIENTWMLEYTRGFIPASLPTGLFAPARVTNDIRNVWNVFWDYADLVTDSFFASL